MNILAKFKETAVSVLPVMAIVILLGLTIVPLDKILLARFVLGGLFLIVGLTIFLLGVDMGIQPMGERAGAELTKKRSLFLLLSVAFVIGFVVTAAEPDIQVFGDQVRGIFPFVSKGAITFVIAAGVGLFIMAGLLRTVLSFSIKITFFVCYLLVFVFAFLAPDSFVGIAFDSGGATTGPMTVPFIMALGLGVANVRAREKGGQDSSFGLTGVCSVGPVLAVLIYAIGMKGHIAGGDALAQVAETLGTAASQAAEVSATAPAASQATATLANAAVSTATQANHTLATSPLAQIFGTFGKISGEVFHESLISIAPLLALFVIFQIFLFKMTKRQVIRIIIGFVYAFFGLTIFLTGVKGGFSQAGAELGQTLGSLALGRGGIWYFVLIFTGVLFGAIIVCAEPAVWVLSEQVEGVSGGTIKRRALLVFLSVGTAMAIALAMWRAVSGFNLKWILVPGYAIAMILMIFCPSLFSGIAFDSGGVASGPLTSTFVLSFTLGAAQAGGSGNDSFGVIALVAMMPLIAIQIMGIIFKIKQAAAQTAQKTEGTNEL